MTGVDPLITPRCHASPPCCRARTTSPGEYLPRCRVGIEMAGGWMAEAGCGTGDQMS